MKLTGKLIVALVLAISAGMAVNAYLRLRTETSLLEAVTDHELRAIGNAVGTGASMVWRREGEEQALRFVRDIDRARDDVDVRWVWLADVESAPAEALNERRVGRLEEGRAVSFVGRNEAGDERRYVFHPLSLDGGPPAALRISTSLASQRAFHDSSRRIVIFTAVGLSLICAVIMAAAGYWLVGRPLDRLRDKARQVGQGRLQPPLLLRQRDEIGELATELNAMCDRLAEAQEAAAREIEQRIATVEQLRHADRLRTVGQLASGVAHELGTPLNVVLGNAKMMRDGELGREESVAASGVIVEQVNRMTSIVRQLLDFSRQRGPSFATTDLVALSRQTLQMLQPMADGKNIRLELSGDARRMGEVDGSQIQQVLANLVVNAIQASRTGGRVTVEVTSQTCGDDPDWVVLGVTDEGPGIPEPDRARVFEPFFTTKDVGDGTGLGLAVAYGIVQEHGGQIDLASSPERTCFSIRLPLRRRVDPPALEEAS